MSLLDGWWYRLRTALRPKTADDERAREFRFHLSLDEMQQRADGAAPSEATARSRRRFGNLTGYGEEVRLQGAAGGAGLAVRRLRDATRSLVRSPSFAVAAIATLGLGIGGVAALGTVVYSVLLKPLPYPEPDRLVALWLRYESRGIVGGENSDAAFFTYSKLGHSLERSAAFLVRDVNLGETSEPERVTAASVTADFFAVFGVAPELGRLFGAAEDRPGAAPVALVSDALWRRKLAADPGIVGRRVRIDGVEQEIIGVLPPGLGFPTSDVGIWRPLGLDPERTLPASSLYQIVARLRPGVTRESARTDLQQATARMAELYPDAGFGYSTAQYLALAQASVDVHPLKADVVGDVGAVLWVLLGVAAFVLLVAGANVTTLFLVRAEARRREAAVRIALGAGRGGLAGHFLAEGLVLAVGGAAVGLALAAVAIRALGHAGAARIPRQTELALDPVTLVGVAILAAIVGLCCSAAPISRLGGVAVAETLRSARGTGGSDRQRVRQMLVAMQIALAFALLAGSGLLARTYRELRLVQPGFDPAGVLAFRVALPVASYPGAEETTRFDGLMAEGLRALPGKPVVGAVTKLPLMPGGESSSNAFWVEDHPELDRLPTVGSLSFVTGDYFRALAIPIVAGHDLVSGDPAVPSRDALVSLSLARKFWPDSTGQAAIGRRIRTMTTMPWLTIVGVVGDVRSRSLEREPEFTIYLPPNSQMVSDRGESTEARTIRARVARTMTWVVRTGGEPGQLTRPATDVVRGLDPSLPVFDVNSMPAIVRASTARTTFTGWMLAGGAGIALVLGIIGVYGVMSYATTMRTREIGLRLALGAQPAAIRRMMVRQSMLLVGIGLAGGLILTLLLTGSLQALLYGVRRNDPLTLLGVALTLGGSAWLATLIPALRAGRVPPTVTLAGD